MNDGFAIVEALTHVVATMQGDAILSGMVGGRIFDVPPQETTFPFVVLAEQSASDWSTKTNDGQAIDLAIEVWSTYEGRLEALTIARRVYLLLHRQPFQTDTFDQFLMRNIGTETTVDGDGATRRVRLRFQILAMNLQGDLDPGDIGNFRIDQAGNLRGLIGGDVRVWR